MPHFVIDNIPESLLERIQRLAEARRQTPADAVVDILEAALREGIPALAGEQLPQEPWLAGAICAPCSIPRPPGERIIPIDVVDYIPAPHDIPDDE